jgi:UDP-N-acetylglucosamine 2-epimerase
MMSGKKMKIVTVVGTRPEIIRLSRVIAKLDQQSEHILVHTGQNYSYELNEIFFDDLGIRKPDRYLEAAGATGAETIGKVIIACDRAFSELQPDALLVLGDTNSCLAVLPAKRLKIPTFHMEAGNRCFDQRVPEEINRKIVDHTADINLPYSSIAREYLLREGLEPDRIVKTGSPMFEVLSHYSSAIDRSAVLATLGLERKKYFLVSAHREENIDPDPSFQRLVEVLNGVAEKYGIPVVVSTHPRTQKKVDGSGVRFHPGIRLLRPLAFSDYIRLQIDSKAVLSDSGTISEESSILGFPALNIREAHERPEAMEEAAVMMVGLSVERVFQCLRLLDEEGNTSGPGRWLVADYNVPNVSDKVVRIIHSYTDYVRRTVWKKY